MKIMIIGAHPDDAESSCGGMALKAVEAGHKVDYLVCTNGDKYGKVSEGASLAEVREDEAKAAAAICGVDVHFLRYRDRELEYNSESLGRIKEFISGSKADLVLAHWPADQHPDHQVAAALTTQAALSLEGVGLAYFEAAIGVQSFGMVANRYFDVSDAYETKRRMIECFKSQAVESILKFHEAMERWYGLRLGVQYAEGYFLYRSTPEIEAFFMPH